MPKMQVVVPADYNQAYRVVLDSYEREGPMYMRFGRPATPFVYEDVPETPGEGHVDAFLPAHNLDSLRALVRHLKP